MGKYERVAKGEDGSGGAFLKLEDGVSVNVVLRGDAFKFYQHWPLGGVKQVFAEPTPGAIPRFKTNAIVFEKGSFVAKVWEYPPMVSNLLADLEEAGYDLDVTKLQIKKTKQGKKTEYSVVPCGPKEQPSPKHLKEIVAVELLPLSITPSEPGNTDLKNYAPGAGDSDIPF